MWLEQQIKDLISTKFLYECLYVQLLLMSMSTLFDFMLFNLFKAILHRLKVLRIVVSHTFLYKKLDLFGHDHNAKIMVKVRNENARMLSLWNNEAGDGEAEVLSNQIDDGRKIVFDNFDFNQKVHHMSESHQNIDKHWVTHMCTENQVSGIQLKGKT